MWDVRYMEDQYVCEREHMVHVPLCPREVFVGM